MTMRKLALIAVFLSLPMLAAAQAAPQPCSAVHPDQKKMQRPSPPGCADFQFTSDKRVVIQYGRPKLNDPQSGKPRTIYGDLVPWGEPWRAGANEATSLVTNANLTIGDTRIPAGSYTLYVQPEKTGDWKLIVNKTTGQWGIPYPGAASDLARIDMQTSKLPSTVQQLTMSFAKESGNAATLNIDWENTRASVRLADTTTGAPVAK
jgi:hypothetical protein